MIGTGCDPCPSCKSKATVTATGTSEATPTATATPTASPTSTPPLVGSCAPAGSMSILVQGTDVSTYVPNGNWGETATGVQLVPIEGTGVSAATTISTANVVNSCSSNSATGQTVCVSNGTDVYLITGSTLQTTLTDGGTGTVNFSGGSCTTCGVVVNSSSNTAILGVALGTASGFQFLNLSNNSLATPISAQNAAISESFAIDPLSNLILSPSEDVDENGTYPANFQLLKPSGTTATIFDFQNAATVFVSPNDELDGGAADCTTGISLSSLEFTDNLFITDLSQATFAPGTGSLPGTWNAPNQIQTFTDFQTFSAGTTGLAIAPSGHLGILEDEGGSSAFGAIQLPATSGTGTPSVVDWVAASMPANDPSGTAWNFPLDPHALTVYVSPSNGKAYGVMVNDNRTYLAKIDLAGLLAATRTAGTHTVDPSVDLVATGVLTFIKMPGIPT